MTKKLIEYNKKRDFNKTNEPQGKQKIRRNKKIFVVQYHRARREHFDLRLEWKGVLLSWAVPKIPSYNPKDKRLAVHVEDHPIDYANFEGVIPKGQYGGGSVMVWDRGYFEPLNDFDEGLSNGVLKFQLFGERLKGGWALVRLEDEKNWLFIKENDDFANLVEDMSQFNFSVVSGRTSNQIESAEDLSIKENPFLWAEVKLALLSEKIPSGKNWLFEIKYDGYRVLTYSQNGRVKFFSRNKNEFTDKFKELAQEIQKWSNSRSFVLDGEMVVLDEEGRSDFQALQNYVKNKEKKPLVYMVFDILALDGEDLRGIPLKKRKDILKRFISDAPQNLVFSEHVFGQGKQCFDLAQKMGLEGIVAKLDSSKYIGGRNEDWLKIKCRKSQEFVVGGFQTSEKKLISSLFLGVFENDNFIFYGKVGTGLKTFEQKFLLEKFSKILSKKSPFSNDDLLKSDNKIFWLKPEIVVEIEYAQITSENLLRQASFKGVREDKNARDVVFEEKFNKEFMKNFEREKVVDKMSKKDNKKKEKKLNMQEKGIKNNKKINNNSKKHENILVGVEISNPQKILFEDCGVKKIDLANYYLSMSKRMLKFVENRVLSVVRCHGQVGEKNTFFKKHPNTKIEGEKIVEIENSEGENKQYFYVENQVGLIGEVQLGTIEFHMWGSRVENLERPDFMVFDLDPHENLSLSKLREGVKDIKKILDTLKLKSFLKTSGGKGYHIVVPFKPTADWNKFCDFAEKVANFMASKWPQKYTNNIRKDSREGKIFVDYLRNGRGATSVAPYSVRARKGAPVSMPIFWSELEKIAPNQINIFNAHERLKKKDPWAGFFDVEQELK